VVSLTKVKKKTREWKDGLIELVRECVEKYDGVYVFRHVNMRNASLKALREEMQDSSRFVLGSTKVLRVALGKSDADEFQDNLNKVSQALAGNAGLFFTNLPREEVEKRFKEFEALDFLRPGGRATEDFVVPEGPVEGPYGPFPHTLEPTFRKHGLQTRLNKGVIENLAENQVAKVGAKVSSDQAALLRHFDLKMAKFKMYLVGHWNKADSKYTELMSEEDLELEIGSDAEEEMVEDLL